MDWRKSLGLILTAVGLGTSSAAEPIRVIGCMLEPSRQVDISSPVGGVIEVIGPDRGDFVRKGSLLFSLRSGVEKAAVDLATVRAEFAQRNVERNRDLYSDDLLSPHERDELETEQRVAQTELRAAMAELDRRVVYSPISGVVIDRLSEEGEYVSVDPVLRLAKLSPLHVEVLMPADLFGGFSLGETLEVMPAQPVGGTYRGKITAIDPIIDSASGTFRLRIELPNPKKTLPAGVRCEIARLPGD